MSGAGARQRAALHRITPAGDAASAWRLGILPASWAKKPELPKPTIAAKLSRFGGRRRHRIAKAWTSEIQGAGHEADGVEAMTRRKGEITRADLQRDGCSHERWRLRRADEEI